MADNEEYDDFDEYDDDEEQHEDEGSGVVESLMSRLGDNGRAALKPVASAAAAAAVTYVAKNGPQLLKELGSKVQDGGDSSGKGGVTGAAAGAVKQALSDSGGALGIVGKVAQKASGSGAGPAAGGKGWGKGRRLPIMASIDVAAPVETVYNQWTQFEDLNAFMHRVEHVEQRSDATVTWHENIWGRRREWNAKITEQIPNERIAWRSHAGNGVITFHKLAPKLTRVELVFDWQPRGVVEKLASGLRFHKRAARADLKRFKAFVETRGEETGAWRGRIEDGKVARETRNRKKRGADIPQDARQHSNDHEAPSNGSGDDDEARESARAERARHRKERAKSR